MDTDDALHMTLMAELKCARLRARLAQLDIDAVHTALDFGIITAEQAMTALYDCGALDFLVLGDREAA